MADAPRGRAPVLVLDGMSLAFRAYFALPADLATSDGRVTNAVHGFTSMLVNLVRDHRPTGVAVAFDTPDGTFRDAMVAGYKGGRPETPPDLLAQFPMIRAVAESLGVPVVEVPGFEADDVLATLATRIRDAGGDVIVVTGDRDCFQLVEDPHVRVLYNRRGVSDYVLYDAAGIHDRTGVFPDRYVELAAMRGDPSDNLPGVPGVGEKTAARLLDQYGDLDGIFAHTDDLSPKLRQNMAASEATVRTNAQLMTLVRDVPVEVSDGDIALGGWDPAAARACFEALELRTLWGRFDALVKGGAWPGPADGATAGGPVPSGGEPAPSGSPVPPGDPPGTLPTEIARPADPEAATAAIAELEALELATRAAPRGTTPVTPAPPAGIGAAWGGEGDPGRSPLAGVLVAAGDPPRGVWLDGVLLAAEAVRAALERLLAAPVAGHQVKEVFRSLLGAGVDGRGLVMDTAVAGYLLDSSRGDYDLETLEAMAAHRDPAEPAGVTARAPVPGRPVVQTFDDVGAPTGRRGGDGEDPVPSVAQAVARARALVAPLRDLLVQGGLASLHDEVEVPLVRVLARMEVRGVRVDVAELRRIAGELAVEARRLHEEVQTLAGHPFNVNSTPQLRTVLYDELRLTPGRKTKTGFSTDAATLETLRDAHPVVDTLLRYREVEKLRSTYGESLLAEVGLDGRIHASFRQTVARTGRLSSDRPNLHNIPVRSETGRVLRGAFVPSEGMRFLVADYDQIELRVIAHLSGDPGLVGAFSRGEDVHRAVAAGIFGVPASEVTRAQRERAKMVSYGLAYGMEAFGLARRLGTGVGEAQEIMDGYFRAFPSVRAYMEQAVEQARAQGFTRTSIGRVRYLPELASNNYAVRQAAERQAMNAGIQGLAADVFKIALVRLDRALEEGAPGSRLVLQIHDEVLVEAPPHEEPAVEALAREVLEGAADLSVPLKVSMAWGSTWGAAKGG